MIKATTFLVTSSNLSSSSVMAKVVPVRSLLSVKQKRLLIASAFINHREEKSLSLLYKLRAYGFEDSQIHKVIESRDLVLNAQRNLTRKLDFLMENGFTGELLHNHIVSCPDILLRSLDARIKPNFQILKQYLGSDEKVVTAINRRHSIAFCDLKRDFIPNIEFLIDEGVPVNQVSHLLATHPLTFLLSRDRVAYAAKTVREIGVAPDESPFIHCLRVVCQLSESRYKEKLQVFKSFGWSDEQVSNAFKKNPNFLCLSAENLRSKIGFYVNTLKLEPDIVIQYPSLLICSVERVRARYEVFKVLKSNKLIEGVKITSVVAISEHLFRKRYVTKYEKRVPGISDMYYGMINERKNSQGKKTET